LWGEGVACGDDSDTECTNPDTCSAEGVCLDNHEPMGAACGDQGLTCTFDDECDGVGACVDNGLFSACPVSGELYLGETGPAEGVTVSIYGTATTTTTDADGLFTIDVPMEQDILLHIEDQPGHYGLLQPLHITSDNAAAPFQGTLDPDAEVEQPATSFGRTVDTDNSGALFLRFSGVSFDGAESASLDVASQTPIVNGSSGLLESSTLMSTNGGRMYFFDVPPGTAGVTLDGGAGGSCVSRHPGIDPWPVVAHTVTEVPVWCE
jgi:hypothetical protein